MKDVHQAIRYEQGRLRIYTGSVWSAAVAHSVHNGAWTTLAAFTLTSNPVMVDEYLAGDNGILILGTTVIAVVLVGRILRDGMNKAQTSRKVPEVTAPTPAATAASR